MSGRSDHRQLDRHRVSWWVVAAWSSLALLVLAGLAAAAGVHLG
ncbi:MAG: molybdopterin oxidoreductase [Actinobacteria bacterium]|nr:molybdopterin oxidoreductase [Actinomycetota bacterium]MCG2801021.1 molybdopterin oxidoreductase [Cellulomonas sp.]